jgi:hypothetical protein
MPAIGDQTGRPITVRRPRKKKPPPPRPSQSFTSSPFQRPFAGQTRQGAQKVQRAVRHLPQPVVATPPVIHNPTPRQVQHAAHQIARSITRAVGTSGSNAEKIARRDAIVAQIRTDPRLHRVNRSLTHWQREQAKLIRPDAYRDRALPGRSDKHARIGVGPLSLATINTTAGARAISNVLAAAAPGLQIRDTPAQFIRNAGGDLKTLAEGPFIGGYALGSAFVGDINESLHGGPVARRETKLVTDALRGTYQTLRHPLKSEGEHPILTPLTFAGIASSAGRVAGAGVRAVGSTPDAGGIRGAAARAGSTARSPIALGDDLGAGIVERRASKDIGRAAVQRARDRSREPLRDVEGNVVTHKGLPVLKTRSGMFGDLERARLNKRRADILASRANLSERLARDVASDELKVRGVRGRAAKDVVAMVTEGTITTARHFERDLRAHVDRLKANIARHDADVRAGRDSSVFRHEGELEKAQRRVKIGSAILSSPKALARAESIVKAGTEHGGRLVGMERESTGAGLGNAEQFRRARLVNVAVEHMDARHGRDPRLTKRIDALKRNERSLQARLNFGHVPPGQRAAILNQLESSRGTRRDLTRQNTERLRTATGDPLHPEHIEDFLRSRGRDPGTVAYLPGNVSRRQFHQQFRPEQGRGMLDDKGTRTGEAHRKGATEASADLIRAAGVRQATALNKAKQVDRAIGEHGMRHPAWAKAEAGQALTKHERRVVARGGYFTGREAAEVIDRAAGRGERLVALRAYPAKLDSATQQMIRDDLQGPAAMDTLGERLINSRFLSVDELKGAGARNVVIVNEDLAKRLQQHLGAAGPLRKFGQIINRAFRYAVLPQPRWMAGNFIEPMLVRMPGVASGVNVFGMATDIRAANRVIKAMERHSDPAVRAAAQEIRAHQFGGLLIGGRGATIHRGLEDFPALNTAAQKAYGRVVAKTPAVAHMLDFSGRLLAKGGRGILKPLDLIFHLNRLGEAGLQRAAFGKSVRRDVQELTGSWAESIRLGDAAAREAAKGLVNTATQHRFMDAQHELLGKYEGFSPTTRALVQSVAPFIPWAMNAARFVFWTMPAHRTAQTAFLIQVNNVVSKDWQEIHKDAPPGMRLAIPTKSGGWVDLARYTPYGFSAPIAEGDLRGIPGQFLPQTSGTEAALEGKDPFGRDLQFSKGQGSNLAVAGNELLEALVPYLSTARRLQEHGETAFADSTVLHPRTKEGTAHGMSGVERTFSPIRPTYLAGSTTDEPVSTPGPSRPATRREALLQRRARLLQGRPGVSGRTQELLRRRAALLRHP